jgi:hypothetical protein
MAAVLSELLVWFSVEQPTAAIAAQQLNAIPISRFVLISGSFSFPCTFEANGLRAARAERKLASETGFGKEISVDGS